MSKIADFKPAKLLSKKQLKMVALIEEVVGAFQNKTLPMTYKVEPYRDESAVNVRVLYRDDRRDYKELVYISAQYDFHVSGKINEHMIPRNISNDKMEQVVSDTIAQGSFPRGTAPYDGPKLSDAAQRIVDRVNKRWDVSVYIFPDLRISCVGDIWRVMTHNNGGYIVGKSYPNREEAVAWITKEYEKSPARLTFLDMPTEKEGVDLIRNLGREYEIQQSEDNFNKYIDTAISYGESKSHSLINYGRFADANALDNMIQQVEGARRVVKALKEPMTISLSGKF